MGRYEATVQRIVATELSTFGTEAYFANQLDPASAHKTEVFIISNQICLQLGLDQPLNTRLSDHHL
jgi:hypothetical protein